MERFHTTVTERASFRACRRQWYLETQERLAHSSRVQWNLIFGDCVHKGLEAFYRGNKRSLQAAKNAFTRQWVKENETLQEVYGMLYDQGIGDEWWEWRDKGLRMLQYYKQFDSTDAFDFNEVLEVNIEARAFVDIVQDDGERIDNLPLLSGKIDLVVSRPDGIWIWDHKTTKSIYNSRALDIDDQGTGYCYIYWRLTGNIPRGFVHNGLVKEPPVPPRVLQNGSLSKDKAQRTTYDLFLAAIKENDLDEGEYEDVLEYLKNKGWDQFFYRDAVVFNEEQLYSFEKRLFHEYRDMERVIENIDFAYPNPTQYMCPGCGVLPICQAMEEGDDPQYLKDTMYAVQEPRTKIPKAILSEKWKGV